jgi:hypothetical protein
MRRSLDSSFGIAMGYDLGGWDSIPSKVKKFLSSLTPIQPSIQWVPGDFSPGI